MTGDLRAGSHSTPPNPAGRSHGEGEDKRCGSCGARYLQLAYHLADCPASPVGGQ